MSKPWSEGGLEADWAALGRRYVIGAILIALALWIAGFSCARVLAHRPDPAVARDAKTSATFLDSLRITRADRLRADSLALANVALHAQLDTMTNRAAATGRAVNRLTHGITIDTSGKLRANPYRSISSPRVGGDSASEIRAPVDTTAMAVVMRADDSTRYLIPKFIGDGFLALQAHAAALQEGWDTEKALRETAESRFVDDSTHRANEGRYADSTIAAQGREVATLEHEGHPVCGWRCGSISTLGLLAVVAYVVRAVIR